MPAEEGFPAYLTSKLSAFHERAGMMHNLNGSVGGVAIIGAVSRRGLDFSEPVTQNHETFVRCRTGQISCFCQGVSGYPLADILQ